MEHEARWSRGRVLAHNMLLRAELERVGRAFAEHRIDWIVLKGLPLAARVYDSLADRFCVDNDVLVRRADVPAAWQALSSVGYEAAPQRSLAGDLASTFQHPMRRQTEAKLSLRLELHWHAFPPHLFPVREELLWSRVERCSLNSIQVPAFDPALSLIHLACHFVQHRCAEPRILRDFGRAHARWQGRVPPKILESLADETGTRTAVAFAMLATWKLGLSPVPPLFSDAIARAVFGLIGPKALLEVGAPGYARMALSILLSSPSRWAPALTCELFPPADVLDRIRLAEPRPGASRVAHVTRLAGAVRKAIRGSLA